MFSKFEDIQDLDERTEYLSNLIDKHVTTKVPITLSCGENDEDTVVIPRGSVGLIVDHCYTDVGIELCIEFDDIDHDDCLLDLCHIYEMDKFYELVELPTAWIETPTEWIN